MADLCRSAQDRLLLVAPFVKAAVLEQLLDQLEPELPVDLVTRWWPWEIVQGVSDLEVWELFRGHGQYRRLFLRQDCHAKYYRADERCLVGSANLTAKALGHVAPANFELLVELPANVPDLVIFEEELWQAAVQVDEDTFARMQDLVAQLPPPVNPFRPYSDVPPEQPSAPAGAADLATWLPQTRQPEDLFLAYTGQADQLSHASAAASTADLAVLNLPVGLPLDQFRAAVRTMLLQTPISAAVDRFVATERRFGEVTQHLADLTGRDDSDRDWQILLRWFRYFAPERYRYRRPRYSELVVRA